MQWPVVREEADDTSMNKYFLSLLSSARRFLFVVMVAYSFPLPCFGIGESEPRIPVPENAVIAGEVGWREIVSTESGVRLLTLLTAGETGGGERDLLDGLLRKLWGLESRHIERITWFVLSVSPDGEFSEGGAVITFRDKRPDDILDTLKPRLSLQKRPDFYTGNYIGIPVCIALSGEAIIATTSEETMAMMNEVLAGRNTIAENKPFLQLMKRSRTSSVYGIARMKGGLAGLVPYPFNGASHFILTMDTGETITLRLTGKALCSDDARKMAGMIGGYVQLLTAFVAAKDRQAGKIAGELLGRIKTEARGSDVVAEAVYSASDIEKAAGLAVLFSQSPHR
ncbi:MAG: hypothetical protein JW881_00250 [Spirochaetales bacterium]|nr:hypothetical protein [Spirochaetales bacterium]